MTTKGVLIVSGGIDSITMAYHFKSLGYDLHLLTFNYGQRHRKEILSAQRIADKGYLNVPLQVIDIRGVGGLLKGSALTDDIPVPDGHYAEESMAITIVPNRNAILLAIAFGVASAQKADFVGIGVHEGDHFIYPDCRPEFMTAFQEMENQALYKQKGEGGIRLFTPFINMTKASILRMGAELSVPFGLTWSCYKGYYLHCGTCGTCDERKEAFRLARIPDPTQYIKS